MAEVLLARLPMESIKILLASQAHQISLRYAAAICILGNFLIFPSAPIAVVASAPPQRAELLARSFDNANLDGNCTLEEAIAHTDGMKILYLESQWW